MTEESAEPGRVRGVAADPTQPPGPLEAGVRIPDFREDLPISANIAATFVTFLFMVIAPHLFWVVVFELIDVNDMAGARITLIPGDLQGIVAMAVAGSILFALIGITLQLWRRHYEFPAWLPMLVAFPAAYLLIVPEALLHGGSLSFWLMVATAIALAFCVHWAALLAAIELRE